MSYPIISYKKLQSSPIVLLVHNGKFAIYYSFKRRNTMADTLEHIHESHFHDKRRVSWGAIIAGVVVAVVIDLTLSVLGAAIGLSYIEPQAKNTSVSAAMKVSFFWWLITWLISLFLGSIVAGKLSGAWSRCSASLHGIVTWAVTVIVTIMLLTSAVGAIIGGAFSIIGTSVKAVTSAVEKVAPSLGQMAGRAAGRMMPEMSQIGKDVNDVISDPNQRGPLMESLQSVLSKGKEASEQDREAVVNILMKRGNMTHDEAEQKLDSWIQSYSQAKEQITETAKKAIPEVNEKATQIEGKAADIGATAAWFAFVMLVLGAFVSALGGLIGTPCCCEKTESRTVRKIEQP
jgi:polyhydroxyalkanoate synthesis regulator phasin